METMTRQKHTSHIFTPGSIPYRLGVGILLLNPNKEVFVAQRLDKASEAWQMPQGGIHPGEAPEDAVMRELEEEIGVSNVNIIRQTDDWFFYDFPNELAAKLWRGKYRGQKQKWFAMEFLGQDSDININTQKPEFSDWKWANPKEVPDIIVDFKRQLYKAVLEEFSDLF